MAEMGVVTVVCRYIDIRIESHGKIIKKAMLLKDFMYG